MSDSRRSHVVDVVSRTLWVLAALVSIGRLADASVHRMHMWRQEIYTQQFIVRPPAPPAPAVPVPPHN